MFVCPCINKFVIKDSQRPQTALQRSTERNCLHLSVTTEKFYLVFVFIPQISSVPYLDSTVLQATMDTKIQQNPCAIYSIMNRSLTSLAC